MLNRCVEILADVHADDPGIASGPYVGSESFNTVIVEAHAIYQGLRSNDTEQSFRNIARL